MERVVEALIRAGCVKFGRFRLSSGRESDVYVDVRALYSSPEELRAVVEELAELIRELRAEYVCGVETSGIPLASILAYELGIPMVYVRKEKKGHGMDRIVEGVPRERAKAVVVDDVSTTGCSIAHAVRALRRVKMAVTDAVVVVDRREGAVERLSELGVRLHSLTTLGELLRHLRSLDKSRGGYEG